jgi:hypothetical protein
LRALRGGAVLVAVALDDGEPQVVLSTFLATAETGDRLAYEPYHVAVELPRDPQGGASAEARAAVAEGRKRQDLMAAKGLGDIVRGLTGSGHGPVVAVLLVNRAGWITDLLEYCLFSPDHPPTAEGLAVRDALRHAIAQCGLDFTELDEKSLPDIAAHALPIAPGELDARLKGLGVAAGKPWRKEQKLACLAAWLRLSQP